MQFTLLPRALQYDSQTLGANRLSTCRWHKTQQQRLHSSVHIVRHESERGASRHSTGTYPVLHEIVIASSIREAAPEADGVSLRSFTRQLINPSCVHLLSCLVEESGLCVIY